MLKLHLQKSEHFWHNQLEIFETHFPENTPDFNGQHHSSLSGTKD
jgi:hypothetical protein